MKSANKKLNHNQTKKNVRKNVNIDIDMKNGYQYIDIWNDIDTINIIRYFFEHY